MDTVRLDWHKNDGDYIVKVFDSEGRYSSIHTFGLGVTTEQVCWYLVQNKYLTQGTPVIHTGDVPKKDVGFWLKQAKNPIIRFVFLLLGVFMAMVTISLALAAIHSAGVSPYWSEIIGRLFAKMSSGYFEGGIVFIAMHVIDVILYSKRMTTMFLPRKNSEIVLKICFYCGVFAFLLPVVALIITTAKASIYLYKEYSSHSSKKSTI